MSFQASSLIMGVCETGSSDDDTILPLDDSAYMHIWYCKITAFMFH